jgi:hypothetical protein
MGIMGKIGILDYSVSVEKVGGEEEGKERKGQRIDKIREKGWRRDRKVGQERAKQVDIWTEWNREQVTIDCKKM